MISGIKQISKTAINICFTLFMCYLAVRQLFLGYCQGDSLTHSIFVTKVTRSILMSPSCSINFPKKYINKVFEKLLWKNLVLRKWHFYSKNSFFTHVFWRTSGTGSKYLLCKPNFLNTTVSLRKFPVCFSM